MLYFSVQTFPRAHIVEYKDKYEKDCLPMRDKKTYLFMIGVCIILAAVFIYFNRFLSINRKVVSMPRDITPRGDLADYEKSTIAIFNTAAPSVVYIFTEIAVSGFFGMQHVREGAGSGFLWDTQGHVVTNFHVLEGARDIKIRLDSGDLVALSKIARRMLDTAEKRRKNALNELKFLSA